MWQRPDSNPNGNVTPRTATLEDSVRSAGGDAGAGSDAGASDPGGPLRATEAGAKREPARGGLRFTYASGSRPLDGYTIKRGIGAGGFGEVYYALSDGGKEVALKLVRRNLEIELRGISHCLNLKHHNLVALYDIKQDGDGDTWVIMEYVGGDCLSDVLAAHPNGLPLEEALAWIHGIGAGAAYLHDRGIVHRDLKPGNVFSDEGVVKIGDYGLSKFISVSRRSGQTESVGTVHYMAPEVANGRYGKQIDIYALGVMLYEVLTGHVPFEGESVGEVLMKHLTAQPDLGRLPESFREPVARCLEKDPEKRIQSVGELLALLPPPPRGVAQASVGTTRPVPLMAAAMAMPADPPPAFPVMSKCDEEPIQRWLADTWGELQTAWQRADMNMFLRTVVVVAAVIAVFSTSGIWLSLILVYAVYRGGRALVLAYSKPKSAIPVAQPVVARGVVAPPLPLAGSPAMARPVVQPAAGAVVAHVSRKEQRRTGRRQRNEQALEALAVKTPREWKTELFGSLLMGAPVAVAMSMVITLLLGQWNDTKLHSNELAWLSLTGAIGTWLVLFPAKFWEGTRGDTSQRRLVMLGIGAGLGVVACILAQVFMVDVRVDPSSPSIVTVGAWNENFFGPDGGLNLISFVMYFAAILAIPSWWKLADPLRESRLSLWSTAWMAIVAFFVSLTPLSFPSQWGIMLAAVVALSVQLSSAWLDRRSLAPRQAAA